MEELEAGEYVKKKKNSDEKEIEFEENTVDVIAMDSEDFQTRRNWHSTLSAPRHHLVSRKL